MVVYTWIGSIVEWLPALLSAELTYQGNAQVA